jgi:RNA polymerase sigma factor (sigma-70 family)
VLTVITLRKCGNRLKYFRAACRDLRREVEGSADGVWLAEWLAVARDPSPTEAAALADTVEQVMRSLEPRERTILQLHLQGLTTDEICGQVERSRRTVFRTLERIQLRLGELLEED